MSGQAYYFQLGGLRFLYGIQTFFLFLFLFFLEKDQADHLMEVGDLGAFNNVVLTCLH